jgi:sodium-coupled neutral amino acid transporter 11
MNMNEEGATETTFRKVSRLAVMANAVNFIGGVSFPSIPFAVKESGLIGGLLLLSLVAILTEASHRLIAESSKFHYKMRWLDIDSYEALVAVPFGRRGELILKFSVFVVAFGACVVSPYCRGGARMTLIVAHDHSCRFTDEGIHHHGERFDTVASW